MEQNQNANIAPEVVETEVLGPATPENQVATDEAQMQEQLLIEQQQAEQANKIGRAKNAVQSQTPSGFGVEPSPEQIIDEVGRLEQSAADQEIMDQAAKAEQAQVLNAEIEKRKHYLAKAAELGMELAPDDRLDPLIEQQMQEQQAAEEQAILEQQAAAERAALAATPSEQEVEIAQAPIRQQKANIIAQEREIADTQIQQEKIKNATQERLDTIDSKIKEINQMNVDPDNYWNKKPTGQKIIAALAMALGAYRQELTGAASNQAIDIINRQIEIDIKEQQDKRKLAVDELSALRADHWKSVQNKLDKMKFNLNEKTQKAQLQNIYSQIQERQQKSQIEAQKLANAEAKRKMLEDPESKISIGMLNKEEQERVVRMPNGEIRLADNKPAADELRKTKNSIEPAMAGAKRILSIANSGSKFNLEDRAKIATEVKAIVGQLRIPFTGPGALTEKEYDRLLDTIGNPNKLFSLPSLEQLKVQTVLKKLTSDLNKMYENAGVTPPITKRQALINKELKNGHSLKDIENNIDSLIKKGRLNLEDYSN